MKKDLEKLCTQVEELIKSFDEDLDAKPKDKDVSLEANGGGDVIKNTDKKDEDMEKTKKAEDEDKEKEEKAKKAKAKKSEDEDKKEDEVDKTKKAKKSDDKKDEDEVEKADDEEDKDKKDDEYKSKKAKKSFEVSETDYEFLQKALSDKRDADRIEQEKSSAVFKSVENLTTLVKSLQEKVETIINKPARDPKALSNLDPLKKSDDEGEAKNEKVVQKSVVLSVMDDLLQKGKVSATDVCEYEACGSISNPNSKALVKAELQKQGFKVS